MAEIRFYTNESVNIAIVDGLKRRGVKIISAWDADNLRLTHKDQLDYAKKNGFVIVTHDDDFLSIALKYEHKGIVYVHQQKYSIGNLIKRLKLLWDIAEQKDMTNHVEFL